jgi:hypothetical protein
MKHLIGLLLILCGLGLSACNNKPDMGNFRAGITNGCRTQAAFVATTGLQPPIAIDSHQRGYQGLRLVSMHNQQAWQHPSWDDAGYIGAFVRDRQGNIYLNAMPNIHVSQQTLKTNNTLYRIDAQSGEMTAFMDLPAVKAASPSNPFGITGLYYDCDTDSLYVSSVAGSGPTEVLGRIYQLDPANKKIIAQLEKTDAFGIITFNGMLNKRLYLGSARSPDIYSVALDANGSFTTDIRYEFSLADLPGGDTSNARKFGITRNKAGDYLMQVKEEVFRFRLMAASNPDKRIYHFSYSTADDRWDFNSISKEQQ